MGKRNVLIEGSSGAGKTSVCDELARRGYQAIHGDRDLRYEEEPSDEQWQALSAETRHALNLWDVERVRALAGNHEHEVTFFCGGSRNFSQFIELFDYVFILDVDLETLNRRLDGRDENDWGKLPDERELVLRLHASKEDIPSDGIVIDATQPLGQVVDEILAYVNPSA
jgi:thymidylate kinase